MGKLMDKKGVLDLAKRLMEDNPGNIREPDNYLSHLEDSYDNARQVIAEACSIYSGLKYKLDIDETSLAAELHDIARPLEKAQLFHELRGAEYIEKNGLKLGISDNPMTIVRIAQMFRSHFVVAEQFADKDNEEKRKEFEPLDLSLLFPRTWQEKIVVYSELTNINGQQISFENRIEDLQKRYTSGSEWAKTNPSLVDAMQSGLERVLKVCEDVQKLRQGKLSEEEIARYGFL
jgi:hypothetical protein